MRTDAPMPVSTPEVPKQHSSQMFIVAHDGQPEGAEARINFELGKLQPGWRVVEFKMSAVNGVTIVALCEKVDEAPAQPGPSREDWLEPLGSNRRRA